MDSQLEFVQRVAASVARAMVGRYGFTRDDTEDLTQDFTLAYLEHRRGLEVSQVKFEPFVMQVVRNKMRHIIRDRRRQRRETSRESYSLNSQTENQDGDSNERGDLLGNCDSAAAEVELRLDIESVLSRLPNDLRVLAECLMQDSGGVYVAAELLETPVRTLYANDLQKIRRAIRRAGLN